MSYSKLYSRINWENEPSTDTPLNETNLNLMDAAIDGLDDRTISLDSRCTNLEGYETAAAASATAAANSATAAGTSATNSATSATQSSNYATLSESYARGGTSTRTGEDTDNAKYYKEQAESIAASVHPINIYDTLTEAEAAASSLADDTVVLVIDDLS